MVGPATCSLILSDDERAELKSLAMRRKTAQALALRARIVLGCAEGGQNTEVAAKLGMDQRQWANGGIVLSRGAWKGCATSRALARRAR